MQDLRPPKSTFKDKGDKRGPCGFVDLVDHVDKVDPPRQVDAISAWQDEGAALMRISLLRFVAAVFEGDFRGCGRGRLRKGWREVGDRPRGTAYSK